MKIASFLIVFSLTACAGMNQVNADFKHEFTYDYLIPGKTKTELWTSAKHFMALTYHDSSKVIKVADDQAGTIIGLGVIGWNLTSMSNVTCDYNYSIKFAAKDGKARMQFDLLNPIGGCGWSRPSTDGYKQIETQFNSLSEALASSLKSDSNQLFKDF